MTQAATSLTITPAPSQREAAVLPVAHSLRLPGSWMRRLPHLLILLSDLLSLLLTQSMSYMWLRGMGVSLSFETWTSALPLTLLFLLGYRLGNLYPGILYHPVEEIRKFTTITALVGLAVMGTLLTFHIGASSLLLHVGVTSLITLFTLPLGRTGLRIMFASRPWWGYPAVIIGSNKAGQEVVQRLQDNPEFGLRAVAIVDEHPLGMHHGRIPYLAPLKQASALALRYNIPYVIVARPDLRGKALTQFIEEHTRFYTHVVVIPDIPEFSNLWRTTRDLHGLFGLTFQQPQQQKGALQVKRIFDLVLASLLILVLSPVLLLIALAVKLTSPGPILYTQYRLGKNGKCFRVLKFRSMYTNATEKLEQLLKHDPEACQEYETFKKLRNDPRVTPLGRILRRYSLDELPQLFNVLRGELSLVGPRAYMPEEINDMEGLERQILRVLPGITGLWQVSGRNQLTFKTRLLMDVYYVKNWSIWLDIYLLARTVPVVLTGRGAH